MSKFLAAFKPPVNLCAFLIPLLTRVRQIRTSVPVAATREPTKEKEPEQEERKKRGTRKRTKHKRVKEKKGSLRFM